MLQAERFELLIGRKGRTLPSYPAQHRAADGLPGVPVLAETLLRMELEVHECSTDLRGFSEAVLADVGATIQILRLAAQEFGEAADRPMRMEDYIANLGPRACMQAAASGSLLRGFRRPASLELWAHSREVAQHFRMLAEEAPFAVSPDGAYLAGLLHAIGALPAVLDWDCYELSGDPAQAALQMAERCRFPGFVKDFFCEILMPGYCPEWATFIDASHHPEKESWSGCPLAAAPLLSFS